MQPALWKCVFHTACGNPETQATQGQTNLQPVPRNEDVIASANQSTKDSLMEPKRLRNAVVLLGFVVALLWLCVVSSRCGFVIVC